MSFTNQVYEPKSVVVRLRPDRQLFNKDIVLDSMDDTHEKMTYHDGAQMSELVKQLASTYPSLAEVMSVPSLQHGQDLLALKLSRYRIECTF